MNSIKELRTAMGWTQNDLAQKMGTTQQTIARWETGKSEVGAPQLRDLSVIFGCSVDRLLGSKNAARRVHSRAASHLSSGEPYGTSRIVFGGGSRDYPIDVENMQYIEKRLFGEFGLEDNTSWLEFAALNNRLVLVNLAAVKSWKLLSDDEEEMPDYETTAVYEALHHDYVPEVGTPAYAARAAIVKRLEPRGTEQLTHVTHVVFCDGTVEKHFLDDEVVSAIFDLMANQDEVGSNAFTLVGAEGGHVRSFVNLSHVALIDVPHFEFSRVMTIDDVEEDE